MLEGASPSQGGEAPPQNPPHCKTKQLNSKCTLGLHNTVAPVNLHSRQHNLCSPAQLFLELATTTNCTSIPVLESHEQ